MKFTEFVDKGKHLVNNSPMPKRRDGFGKFEIWFCNEFGIEPLQAITE